ncbi:phenylacetic acid degradation bifunctional protein PaaZ [bacterium]|nr:phenylacetic acid degradation bifunctional protein PaaZ [bacterium]
MIIESYLEDQWIKGKAEGAAFYHAVSGDKLGQASSAGFDFKSALNYARRVGGPNIRKLTFHQRALKLKELAKYLTERKEEFYEVSKATGATRTDSWIDIEGGIGTLFVFSSKARRELPNQTVFVDGIMEGLSKGGTFVGQHICLPLEGVAIHINAFNFPCWGMLEKFAPTFIAGMPTIVKPATATCYLAQKMVRAMIESKILPAGSLQLVCGNLGDTFDHLTCQDVVTLTGSAATGQKLKTHPKIIENAVRFNLEADSLNCSILGRDVTPGKPEFEIFIKEVTREMTVKAGQKCTAIRRTIVPEGMEEAVLKALKQSLERVKLGDPSAEGVKMGPLASKEQVQAVISNFQKLKNEAELVYGNPEDFEVIGADRKCGAFFPALLLHADNPLTKESIHSVEAFGPVNTVMGYNSSDEAVELARLGRGSLVGSLVTADNNFAREVIAGVAPYHGRFVILNADCAKESTGHGSPMPHLVHGGPGRAGGGEEMGGMRAVMHYMQRTAVQGSPTTLGAICNTWMKGGEQIKDPVHPFRKYYEELQIGETLITENRLITPQDVDRFADLSGDHFYAHKLELGAQSIFEKQVAHGYFVLSASAGLFVDPAPGPVLANYGLENLRFTNPVFPGDSIHVRLTCKQKYPREGEDRGVVAWDVEVFNQDNLTVAVYTILTLVKMK